MVFCGKPSKGCAACRNLRTKCDRGVPACSQCIKASRVCPGYRDGSSLMFRDETAQVIERATASDRQSKGLMPFRSKDPVRQTGTVAEVVSDESTALFDISDLSDFQDLDDAIGIAARDADLANDSIFATLFPELGLDAKATTSDDPRLANTSFDRNPFVRCMRSLSSSLEDQAICFFKAYYISGGEARTRGNFDYLMPIYEKAGTCEVVRIVVDAVSYAALGQSKNQSKILAQADRRYLAALRATNTALTDSRTAVLDSTLIAVQLLSLYETIACKSEANLDSWTNHVNGLSTLLIMRGRQQLHSPLGLRLFMQILSSIWIACLKCDRAVPPGVIQLRKYAERLFDPEDPPWMVSSFFVEIIQLRSRRSTTSPREILDEAQNLDRRIKNRMGNFPPGWQCETFFTSSHPELVYEGYYFVYGLQWRARFVNLYRIARLLAMECVWEAAEASFKSTPPLCDNFEFQRIGNHVRESTLEMIHSFCASVPEQSGYHGQLYAQSWQPTGYRPKVHGALTLTQLLPEDASPLIERSTLSSSSSSSATNTSSPISISLSKSDSDSRSESSAAWPDIEADIAASIAVEDDHTTTPAEPAPSRAQTFAKLLNPDRHEAKVPYYACSAHVLAFPMFMIGLVPLAPTSMKFWIAKQLKRMALALGNRQAYVLGETIEGVARRCERKDTNASAV